MFWGLLATANCRPNFLNVNYTVHQDIWNITHGDEVSEVVLLRLVIEPILVLNLVQGPIQLLGLGTEPPADRSPIRRLIV